MIVIRPSVAPAQISWAVAPPRVYGPDLAGLHLWLHGAGLPGGEVPVRMHMT